MLGLPCSFAFIKPMTSFIPQVDLQSQTEWLGTGDMHCLPEASRKGPDVVLSTKVFNSKFFHNAFSPSAVIMIIEIKQKKQILLQNEPGSTGHKVYTLDRMPYRAQGCGHHG